MWQLGSAAARLAPLKLPCGVLAAQVPIRTLVVNQVLPHGLKDKYLQVRAWQGCL